MIKMVENAPDQANSTIHPRENYEFIGNENAEIALFEALNGERMHHAWLFHGAKNIGKATLAYRFARRYLGAKPSQESPLASYENDPICQNIAQNSCPDLRVATRYCPQDEKVKSVISIHAIRELISMFDLRANNSLGRRVAIIDCADEMNEASSNALLKTLEEPPKGAIIILLANSLGRVLPTIRSRCRLLGLDPLSNEIMKSHFPRIDDANLVLSQGCVGRVKVLDNFDIENTYRIISRALETMPNPTISSIIEASKLGNDIEKFEIVMAIIENWLSRAASASMGLEISEISPGESANMARLFGQVNLPKIYDAWKNIALLKQQVANQLDKSTAIIEAFNQIKAQIAR